MCYLLDGVGGLGSFLVFIGSRFCFYFGFG